MSKEIEEALTRKAPKRTAPVPDADLLKTGATVLDLAISGRRKGGFCKGKYFWIVGDSSSGKTFLTLTCLAEASINKFFDEYRFIFDNAEDGALMEVARYFGKRLAARLEPPAGDKKKPVFSETIEDFYYNLDDALEGDKPFIYVLDSMDSLGSKYADKKFQEKKTEARGGKKAQGDYGDGKAKFNSTRIRSVVSKLRKTGSILIILSQTRDNIDAGMYGEQQTSAGGRALKFYSTVQLWSSVGEKIKKTVNDRQITVGVYCRVKTRKNRITGKERTVEFPIYYDVGIDDIGGMVDWLTYWKIWSVKVGMIDASEAWDGVVKRRDDLIKWIEENDMRQDLEEVVEAAWAMIESKLEVKRKSKYE